MKLREFKSDENWPRDLILVRVMADGFAYVAEPTSTIPDKPIAVPEAIRVAQRLLGYREVAVLLEPGAEWSSDWGELDRSTP